MSTPGAGGEQFSVYLSSLEGSEYFSQNTCTDFTNVLPIELTDMCQYDVALAELIITPRSSPGMVVQGNQLAHVCSNIVKPVIYGSKYMSILGLHCLDPSTASIINTDHHIYTYRPVATNRIKAIRCMVTDHVGQPLQLLPKQSVTVIGLHFRKRQH